METLELPRQIVNQLLTHAQKDIDQEVCGFISAENGRAKRCYPIKNIAATPNKRFEMEPTQQIEAMRKIREQDETVLAVYHSHPQTPAKPSTTDLADNQFDEMIYLIISLDIKGVLQMNGWRLSKTHDPQPLNLLFT